MTRALAIVATVGFVLSIVCFTAAGLVGGASWNGVQPWRWGHHWIERWPHINFPGDEEDAGPTISRDYAWGGGRQLTIEAPADVQYTQGPVAKITVTGPKDELDRLVVENGRIGYRGWTMDGAPIKVVMTAPDVTHFETDGSQNLTINGYDQTELTIDLMGSGDVTAKGVAKQTTLNISGSGDGDLGGLTGDGVKVEINGSGDATIAPKASADVHVAGSGDVVLLTHPATLNTDISGSGSVRQSQDKPAKSA